MKIRYYSFCLRDRYGVELQASCFHSLATRSLLLQFFSRFTALTLNTFLLTVNPERRKDSKAAFGLVQAQRLHLKTAEHGNASSKSMHSTWRTTSLSLILSSSTCNVLCISAFLFVCFVLFLFLRGVVYNRFVSTRVEHLTLNTTRLSAALNLGLLR